MRSLFPIFLLITSALLCMGMVSAAEIFAEETVCAPGDEKIVDVWLSETPTGLAGYIMKPVLKGDEVATIQFIPSEKFDLSNTDEETMTASALDLTHALSIGTEPILLGTLHISASKTGESVLYFEITEMTDDIGDPIEVAQSGIKIQVQNEGLTVPAAIVGLDIQP